MDAFDGKASVKTAIAMLICNNRRDGNIAKKLLAEAGRCPPPPMFISDYESFRLMML